MSISEVSAFFFDQVPRWIRYQESRGHLEGIGGRTAGGDRVYTLQDVREMAHELRHFGTIDDEGFRNCIDRINQLSKPVFKRRKTR